MAQLWNKHPSPLQRSIVNSSIIGMWASLRYNGQLFTSVDRPLAGSPRTSRHIPIDFPTSDVIIVYTKQSNKAIGHRFVLLGNFTESPLCVKHNTSRPKFPYNIRGVMQFVRILSGKLYNFDTIVFLWCSSLQSSL